jgi:hypothetical protein
MARVTGLEPATSGVTGRRSNQLSYTRLVKQHIMECVATRSCELRHPACKVKQEPTLPAEKIATTRASHQLSDVSPVNWT